ncbi:hypothetical protein [Candidatus Enterococcus ferrettii]|uniref:Uncharacterized protein n=1 Tax=Candidatus Enterococcus ferrettii TaxID=2815324 RepID=A0ABV0ETE7_9ENTE|nr:hypothetical protein [Enterococcus sp. 665A]MBO1342167.1 hypothetical protein [Enterococcus sp. 665A]
MTKHFWQVENDRLYFQIGDTLNKVMLVPNFFEEKLVSGSLKHPFLCRQDPSKSYYFSDSFELTIVGEQCYHSAAGDICYFPDWGYFGISLAEEEYTLGIPRYKIGKLAGDLSKIQSLTTTEEAKLYWQIDLRLKE